MNSLSQSELSALANDINREHAEVEQALRSAVGHAIKAGELLIEAKAKVGHGQWLPWLKANCHLSERTAQAYMRLAREYPKLDPAKAQRVADLPVREAIKELSAPGDNETSNGLSEIEQICQEFSNINTKPEDLIVFKADGCYLEEAYIAALHLLLVDSESISDHLGLPVKKVEGFLSPQYPFRSWYVRDLSKKESETNQKYERLFQSALRGFIDSIVQDAYFRASIILSNVGRNKEARLAELTSQQAIKRAAVQGKACKSSDLSDIEKRVIFTAAANDASLATGGIGPFPEDASGPLLLGSLVLLFHEDEKNIPTLLEMHKNAAEVFFHYASERLNS